ncbi:MAG: ABC transporter permease subunit [Acidobacteriota bacterium]
MSWPRLSPSSPPARDRILGLTARATGLLGVSAVVLVGLFLLKETGSLLGRVPLEALFGSEWQPSLGRYGLAPILVGSVTVTLGSVLLATPLGVLLAVFLQFHAPPSVATVLLRGLELLAGVPSVVFGFLGLTSLAPLLGQTLLTGVLVLGLMILPTLALLAHSGLASVGSGPRLAAAALGLSVPAIAWRVIVPAARRTLTTAVLLATGRALGETMAVLMVTGNVIDWPRSLTAPVRTLTAHVALEMSYAEGDHRAALFLSGLVLFLLAGALVVLGARLGRAGATARG